VTELQGLRAEGRLKSTDAPNFRGYAHYKALYF
jgi:hypothetical protein